MGNTTAASRSTLSRRGQTVEELLEDFLATRDPVLCDELVERHRWLARACARQMRRFAEPLDELEQVAMIGVYKAVTRFDPSFDVQFKTYASVTAIGELRRHYRDAGWALRVPRRVKDAHMRVQLASAALTSDLGRSPTVDELARWTELRDDEVIEALDARGALFTSPLLPSTQEPSGGDDEDPQIAAWLDSSADRTAIRALLGRLDERKQRIVLLRYFGEMTQQEIGRVLGISQVQISRLLRVALAEMRGPGESCPSRTG